MPSFACKDENLQIPKDMLFVYEEILNQEISREDAYVRKHTKYK